MNRSHKALIACFFIIPPLLYGAAEKTAPTPPTQTAEQAKQSLDELIYSWSRTFAEVLQTAYQKHYKISKFEECMTKALDTFLSTLDPHSNILDPKTYKHMLEATGGEFFGIGIVIDNTRTSKDKSLTVIETIPDGPADKAGLKQYDKIVEIENTPLEGMATDEATAKLKGERNTKVHVKVLREGHTEIFSFDITRDVIKEQNSLCFYLEDQNIYYLSLSMFTETSAKQLENLLNKAKEKNYRGLILDLRNNSGGLLSSAVDIAGLFVEQGSLVVTTKDKTGAVVDRYDTNRKPIASKTPIFVLINNFTASASEILAGVLKIHADKAATSKGSNSMVFLAGDKTFGKGSVQEVSPISNNCAIKITTSLYFLPNDTSIQGEGITPDFEIERRFPPTEQQLWFGKNYGREKALPNYIKLISDEEEKKQKDEDAKKEKEKRDEKKTWTQRAQQMLETDNQLRETINLINLLHMASTSCPQNINTRQDAIKFLNGIYVTNKKIKLVEVKV